MKLCAYRIHHGMKAGIWVEDPEWIGQRPVRIIEALRYAFDHDEALLLEFEPWEL